VLSAFCASYIAQILSKSSQWYFCSICRQNVVAFAKFQVKPSNFDGISKRSAIILDSWIFQGSLATVKVKWKTCKSYIESFLGNLTVKEFCKFVYICRSYDQKSSVLCVYSHCRWLFWVEWQWHNTVFDSKRSPICAQSVYFLHSTMPSVTCLRLVDNNNVRLLFMMSALPAVLLIFSFQFSLLFFHIGRQAARRRIGLRNMRHRTLPKIWVGTYFMRNVHPMGMILNWF